jgi:phosphoribosylamine--glycine ligase
MRPGWPTFNIQMALNQGDSIEWLMDLTNGSDTRNFLLDRVAMGVVLSIPDYPYSHITRKEVLGIPIYGIKPGMWEHLHPCEMMLDTAPNDVGGKIVNMPMPCTAGDYVMVMTAVADTISQAKETVYRRLKRLVIPNSPMYRTDIGDRLSKQLPLLQAKGYATGMTF